MFGFLTSVGNDAIDPLTDSVAAESFWRALPKDNPIAAQKALCVALAEPIARATPTVDRLQALRVLDQRARILVDALVVNNVAGNPETPADLSLSWQAAFELCRSFGRIYGQVLRSMRDSQGAEGLRDHQAHVLLRLFQHSQIELLLRPFSDEQSTRFPWKEVHEAYRFAQSRRLQHQEFPINRNHSPDVVETTMEREYLHVLMQDLMNGGNFPPHDAFWLSQRIPRWCRALTLAPPEARGSEHGFVVDPHGDAGLARSNGQTAATCLCVDMTSVIKSIADEIATLREGSGRPSQGSSPGRGRQLRVLNKLDVLCAPERPVIPRRGERKPAALTVEAALGLPQILRALRDAPGETVAAPPRFAARSEGMTITGFGGSADDSTGTYPNGANTVTQGASGAAKASRALLTMVDHSVSGCRLHGPALVTNPPTPGVLIAFREDAAASWTLAVVRRVKKRLAGKRVEIGVEYLGKDPRWVVVVAGDSETTPGKPSDVELSRFAALYLPESGTHPVLPIKTLVLPARGLSPDDRLSIRSRKSIHTIRLKEPLEEQADFIWSPFEILDRRQRDEKIRGEAMLASQ